MFVIGIVGMIDRVVVSVMKFVLVIFVVFFEDSMVISRSRICCFSDRWVFVV